MGEPVPRQARSEAPRVPRCPGCPRGHAPARPRCWPRSPPVAPTAEIAEVLHLSVRTVEKHVERLIMKTGHGRSELARLAESAGVHPTA